MTCAIYLYWKKKKYIYSYISTKTDNLFSIFYNVFKDLLFQWHENSGLSGYGPKGKWTDRPFLTDIY